MQKETRNNLYSGNLAWKLKKKKKYVCLNDGSGTRGNVRTGAESAIGLTLESDLLAGICSWQVLKEKNVGSDLYPVSVLLIEKHLN